jgi:excinuclease ABC subunit A
MLGLTGEPAGAAAAMARAAKANGTPKAAAKPRATRSRAKAAV